MVWCGISAAGALNPIFVKPGAKINNDYYQKNVLKQFLKMLNDYIQMIITSFIRTQHRLMDQNQPLNFLKNTKFNLLNLTNGFQIYLMLLKFIIKKAVILND